MVDLEDVGELLYQASHCRLKAMLLKLVDLLHDLALRLDRLVYDVVDRHPEPHTELHVLARPLIHLIFYHTAARAAIRLF